MKLLIALLFVASLSHSAVRNVCASGCTYATIADALNVANANDIIQLKAGETFTENVSTVIPVWFRSSQYTGLPARGTRINPTTHAPLLATIAGIVFLGPSEAFATGYDLTANTLTFGSISSDNIWAAGKLVACWVSTLQVSGMPPVRASMPGGMPNGEYIIRSFDSMTHATTFSDPATGALIDLTSAPGHADGGYSSPQCVLVQQSAWTFDGIKIQSATASPLLTVGQNMLTIRSHGPRLFFRHSIASGVAGTWTGPSGGIHLLDGINHVIEDSYVTNIVSSNGAEAKAITINNSDYVAVRNNYLSGQSITLLTGGGDNPAQRPVSSITITGNRFEKPGYMWYRSATTGPTGACQPGALARDTIANQCYECSALGAWGGAVSGSLCPTTRPSIKNLLELKEGDMVEVVGNSFSGQPQTVDAGQGFAWGISVINTALSLLSGGGGEWVYAHNIKMANNYTHNTRSGLYLRTSQYDDSVFTYDPIANIQVYNNYFDELTSWPMQGTTNPSSLPTLTFSSGTQGAGTLPVQNITGMMMTYNTFRAAASAGPWYGYFGSYGVPTTSAPQSLIATIQNNLFEINNFDGVSANGFQAEQPGDLAMSNCNQGWTALGGGYVTYNAFKVPASYLSVPASLIFNGAFVKAGCAPYGGGNQYIDTDPAWVNNVPTDAAYTTGSSLGGPLGTDYAQLTQYKTAAEAGVPTANVLMALQVQENTGSLTFRFAATMGSCTATIYTSQLRTGGTAGSGASPLTVSTTAGAKWYGITCASAPGGSLSWIAPAVVH